jgi:hypothetical protein
MKSFAERLQSCVDKGHLTGADLSIWFGRPYPTVRTWHLGLSEPWRPWRGEAEAWLRILENLIAARKMLPMPSSFSALDRRHHIKMLRDAEADTYTRLPKPRSA